MAGINPFAGRDVRWLLDARAEERADCELLVWRPHNGERRAWNYVEFREDVDRLAGAFQRRDIAAGDHVCIHMDNCPEFLLAWFALHTIGAVIVTTNTRCTADELTYFLLTAGVDVTITEAQYTETVNDAISTVGRGRTFIVGASLDALLAEDAPPLRVPINPAAPAGVQFTSGTTSRPKGVVWTHANYLWGGKVSATHERLGPDDRHLIHLPLFHTNAQSYSVMASLWAGGTIVLTPGFSASRFWDVALSERTTWSAMVPFAVKALRRHPIPAEHWFRAWGNGIAVPSWDEQFGVPTLTWWGMTETVSHPIVSEPDSVARPMSMGRASTEYEVRLADDSGAPLGGPGTGLLEVRGTPGVSLMLGYLHDADATAAAYTADGWMRTGDRVELHPDGWFSFIERDKDMLKIGGENVAALEIERVINGVPGVQDSAVVAGRDPMLDEVPVAFVVGRSPAVAAGGFVDEVLEACRLALADFKVPRLVVIVDELPRSTLNKVAKSQLRPEADRLIRAARDTTREVRA